MEIVLVPYHVIAYEPIMCSGDYHITNATVYCSLGANNLVFYTIRKQYWI